MMMLLTMTMSPPPHDGMSARGRSRTRGIGGLGGLGKLGGLRINDDASDTGKRAEPTATGKSSMGGLGGLGGLGGRAFGKNTERDTKTAPLFSPEKPKAIGKGGIGGLGGGLGRRPLGGLAALVW